MMMMIIVNRMQSNINMNKQESQFKYTYGTSAVYSIG